MNQIEAGIKENRILGTRLANQYADLMSKHAGLWHDTVKGISKIFGKSSEQFDPLVDFYR